MLTCWKLDPKSWFNIVDYCVCVCVGVRHICNWIAILSILLRTLYAGGHPLRHDGLIKLVIDIDIDTR